MRIKIIGDNDCARATRHLLRLAGFAVTEFLPEDAVAGGPLAGYAITIDLERINLGRVDLERNDPERVDLSPFVLAPAPNTPESHLRPDPATHQSRTSAYEEAYRSDRGASSPAFSETVAASSAARTDGSREGGVTTGGGIHFDSVESALEAAVLRHVAQLAAAPVMVDRPGGLVHSDRELRIVLPNTGNAEADQAAAVAVEFGVLRGLLDLSAGAAGDSGEDSRSSRRVLRKKKWWVFGILALGGALGVLRGSLAAAPSAGLVELAKSHRLKPAPLGAPLLRSLESQEQMATGAGFRITDGNNFLVVDPCAAQAKLFASISQTGNTQLASGTALKKIYVCSIHVVAAAAANVAVVEGTGSVCGTGTAGVSGFGGATAATGWNFAANGGIALGNGDSAVGAEASSGDNLCVFNSGSGQISGGISYVVQ